MPKVKNASKAKKGANPHYGLPPMAPGDTHECAKAEELCNVDPDYQLVKATKKAEKKDAES